MWCSHCQQDSPAAGQALGSPCCSKCGKAFDSAADSKVPAQVAKDLFTAPLLTEEDWALEAELHGMQRLIGSLKAAPTLTVTSSIDEPQQKTSGWHIKSSSDHSSPVRASDVPNAAEPKANPAAWTILSISVAAFACGAVLLAWSFIARRDDLWPVGMPLALVGQAGLILGLILQLDGLWSSNRRTVTVLSELDSELARVRQATTLLSSSRTSAAQSFYVHLAEGAPPQLLLADLKGQLDLLAQQMSKSH